MSFLNLEQGMEQWHALSFDYTLVNVESGISYLGFFIKPNDYAKKDWVWLLAWIENRLKMWCNRWVSHGGRIILINSILEAILVYWFSLSTVPANILQIIRIICKNFLWAGMDKQHVFWWTSWKSITRPKVMGGWGLKDLGLFC